MDLAQRHEFPFAVAPLRDSVDQSLAVFQDSGFAVLGGKAQVQRLCAICGGES
jgi:hypothetical protein